MQGREKKHWLHQFALYPSKGFGPEAQSKFLYRQGASRAGRRIGVSAGQRVSGSAYWRIGVSACRRVGAMVGQNRSGEARICEPGAMEGCGSGVAERWPVSAKGASRPVIGSVNLVAPEMSPGIFARFAPGLSRSI